MLTKLKRILEEHSENFNKELGNIKKNWKKELKNTINLKKKIHNRELIVD